MQFAVGQRVRVKNTVEVPELYPGATGTVTDTGEDTLGFIRVRVDLLRADDEIGSELVKTDGGWLYAEEELEAI